MSGNVKHPLAKVFDALVEGGVSTSQVHAVARKILAAYDEANATPADSAGESPRREP